MVYSVFAQVSKERLKIVPDQSPSLIAENDLEERSFLVDVTNQSDLFASFQVELLADGTDANSALKWYEVEPEICAKKPPGDRTQFKVRLTRAPIPAYNTEVKVIAKILSVESEQLSTTQTLLLQIDEPQKPLKVELPFKDLKVYPGDQLEIPVVAYNLSSKFAEITLELTELDLTWIKDKQQKIVQLSAGGSAKVLFFVEPPRSLNPTNQIYNFAIEATQGNNTDSDFGRIEVMPFGIVEVTCAQPIQSIPSKPLSWMRTAQFPLQFSNKTNQIQEIQVDCNTEDQWIQWEFNNAIKIEPNGQDLEQFKVERPRPWFGWKRRSLLQLEPTLIHPESGKPNDAVQIRPSTQSLELLIYPRIPLFVQIGAILLAGLCSFIALNQPPLAQHNAPVTSVRISSLQNTSNPTIFSASNDKTVRRWALNTNLLRFLPWESKVPLSPDGEIAGDTITGKGIRVIRVSPDQEKIAIGKENGEIELWNTASPPTLLKKLLESRDRVFDLAFTDDGKTLFSGHGGGTVKVFWNLDAQKSELETSPDFGFAISALAVDSQSKSILIGGGYNQLSRWNWKAGGKGESIPYFWDRSDAIFTHNHYINSIAIAQQTAVTSDNAGHISTWDLEQSPPRMRSQWQTGGNQSVRAVAISKNGCFVASAGNDGKLMLYTLKQKQRQPEKDREIAKFSQSIRAVDIQWHESESTVLIASDAPNNEVQLYRIEVNNHDCQ